MEHDRIRKLKDIASTIQSFATIGALVLGGIWTYQTFIEQRLGNPRVQITQKVSHLPLSDKYNMLVVDETLTNVGSVLLRLRQGGLRIIKVLPLPDAVQHNIEASQPVDDSDKGRKCTWEVIDDRRKLGGDEEIVIEPGENDQIHYEFILPSSVQAVTVISYVRNPNRSDEVFWRSIGMYDFRNRVQIVPSYPAKTELH